MESPASPLSARSDGGLHATEMEAWKEIYENCADAFRKIDELRPNVYMKKRSGKPGEKPNLDEFSAKPASEKSVTFSRVGQWSQWTITLRSLNGGKLFGGKRQIDVKDIINLALLESPVPAVRIYFVNKFLQLTSKLNPAETAKQWFDAIAAALKLRNLTVAEMNSSRELYQHLVHGKTLPRTMSNSKAMMKMKSSVNSSRSASPAKMRNGDDSKDVDKETAKMVSEIYRIASFNQEGPPTKFENNPMAKSKVRGDDIDAVGGSQISPRASPGKPEKSSPEKSEKSSRDPSPTSARRITLNLLTNEMEVVSNVPNVRASRTTSPASEKSPRSRSGSPIERFFSSSSKSSRSASPAKLSQKLPPKSPSSTQRAPSPVPKLPIQHSTRPFESPRSPAAPASHKAIASDISSRYLAERPQSPRVFKTKKTEDSPRASSPFSSPRSPHRPVLQKTLAKEISGRYLEERPESPKELVAARLAREAMEAKAAADAKKRQGKKSITSPSKKEKVPDLNVKVLATVEATESNSPRGLRQMFSSSPQSRSGSPTRFAKRSSDSVSQQPPQESPEMERGNGMRSTAAVASIAASPRTRGQLLSVRGATEVRQASMRQPSATNASFRNSEDAHHELSENLVIEVGDGDEAVNDQKPSGSSLQAHLQSLAIRQKHTPRMNSESPVEKRSPASVTMTGTPPRQNDATNRMYTAHSYDYHESVGDVKSKESATSIMSDIDSIYCVHFSTAMQMNLHRIRSSWWLCLTTVGLDGDPVCIHCPVEDIIAADVDSNSNRSGLFRLLLRYPSKHVNVHYAGANDLLESHHYIAKAKDGRPTAVRLYPEESSDIFMSSPDAHVTGWLFCKGIAPSDPVMFLESLHDKCVF